MAYINDNDASNVFYNKTTSGLGNGDVQSALDSVASTVASGPAGLAVSANISTATSSTTAAALNAMTLSPTQAGNYAVNFTGQFNSTNDCQIWVYVGATAAGATQYPNSLRQASGPAGGHNFSMATGEKVTVTSGQSIFIFWASASGSTVTCTGRNMSAIKVT